MNEQTPQDAIKEALKRHDSGEPLREELLKALRAEGVNTIPELVDRLLAFRESSHRKPHDGAVLAGSALARIDKPQPEHKEIVHRPPSVPLCVDGVAIEPAEIVQFNGRALHFVVSKLPQEGEVVLYAFTGTDYLRFLKGAYVASLVPQDYGDGSWPPGQSQGPGYGTQCGWMGGQPCLPPFPTPFSPPFTYWQIQMFSDSQYGGDWFWLYAGYAYPDLRQVDRNCFLWSCDDWNDTISSLAGAGTRVTYFQYNNYGGSSLTIPANTPIPDLGKLGWNDGISSVVNWNNLISVVFNW